MSKCGVSPFVQSFVLFLREPPFATAQCFFTSFDEPLNLCPNQRRFESLAQYFIELLPVDLVEAQEVNLLKRMQLIESADALRRENGGRKGSIFSV
eukprot:3915810-Rhodomonas_salina.2